MRSIESQMCDCCRGHPQLYHFIYKGRYRLAARRLKSHPEEASFRGGSCVSATPLHLACGFWFFDDGRSPPPLDLIGALLDASVGATEARDDDGDTPLLVAVKSACQMACGGDTKPGDIVRADLESLVDIIGVLVERNPLALDIQDYTETGTTPVTEIVFEIGEKRPRPHAFSCLWRLIEIMLQHTEQPLPTCAKQNLILHSCVGMEQCCFYLLQLILHFHPDEIKKRDHNGNNALHVAAALGSRTMAEETFYVSQLIGCRAEQAQEANNDGRLPLHMALEAGKTWRKGVKAIHDAFPAAVAEPDRRTRMYPFMLAAEGPEASLDTTYELLRAFPEMERFRHHETRSQCGKRNGSGVKQTERKLSKRARTRGQV